MTSSSLGAPLDRVDGRLKVTGGAKFAAEFPIANAAHGVIVTSTIAKGRVTAMDTPAAMRMPGVISILTPFTAQKVNVPPPLTQSAPQGAAAPSAAQTGGQGQPAPARAMRVPTVVQSTEVHYNGQPIGLVVADTFEHALEASHLVKVSYAGEKPVLDIENSPKNPPETVRPFSGERVVAPRGRDRGMADAVVRVDHVYTTPLENHNPMEVHNTVAVSEGSNLTVYDSTQGIFSVRNTLARAFGLQPANVRVVSYFTGGGFGSKGGPWSHQILAAMGARAANRPVKLSLTRRQMFGPVGGRAHTSQRVALGATRDGALTAISHERTSNTSTIEDWVEPAAVMTHMLYACPNVRKQYDLVRVNIGSPTFMRAPGESPGTFALESALDELAYALAMDPVDLRLKNYAERDPASNKPFSSNSLRGCYALGAEKFGWKARKPAPRSMRDGNWLIGYGLGTATYPARRAPASTTARMTQDGRVTIRAGTQEIGCGTYTVMSQIAADALGIPVDRVTMELGATDMPVTPASVGSLTASSTGSAVHIAALALKQKLEGMMQSGESFTDGIRRAGGQPVEVTIDSMAGPEAQQYSMHSFGAVFTEVRVEESLGIVRIPRIVTAHGVGIETPSRRASDALATPNGQWSVTRRTAPPFFTHSSITPASGVRMRRAVVSLVSSLRGRQPEARCMR
jgi:xanthine dehydrogenase YagR molybdenum-binding subunit